MAITRFTSGALAQSRFRWFYLARTISLFGSGMTPVALAFAVLAVPHGQQLLGYILAAELMPNVLMLLIGGSMADRYRRDRLIQLANVGSGFTQAGIAVVVLTGMNPYWIFPLAVANGILGAFTAPATRGIVPELVQREQLKEANSLLNASRSAAKVVGPAVAGILVATLGGGWGIALDALSFFLAALCMARVNIPAHLAATTDSLLIQMKQGWVYFRSSRWIWSVSGAWGVMNAVQMGAWQVLGPVIAKHSFGATGWGLTLSVRAVGLMVASVMMLRLSLSRPVRDSMLAAALIGLPMVLLGRGTAWPYLMLAALVAGFGSTISTVAWDTALQQGVPRDKISRVMAFDDFGAYVMIPLGEILALPLANRWGVHTVETWGGLIFMVTALLPLSLRVVRQKGFDGQESAS